MAKPISHLRDVFLGKVMRSTEEPRVTFDILSSLKWASCVVSIRRQCSFVLLHLCVLSIFGFSGCSATVQSPDEEFKAISDAKKAQVTRFLTTKQSELHQYKATVNRENDVEKSIEYPYVGEITFSYRIGEKKVAKDSDSTLTSFKADELTATYQYSKSEQKWLYRGAYQSDHDAMGLAPATDPLVQFSEMLAAFEN